VEARHQPILLDHHLAPILLQMTIPPVIFINILNNWKNIYFKIVQLQAPHQAQEVEARHQPILLDHHLAPILLQMTIPPVIFINILNNWKNIFLKTILLQAPNQSQAVEARHQPILLEHHLAPILLQMTIPPVIFINDKNNGY